MDKRNTLYSKKETLAGFLFAMPAILGFLIFTLGPMAASLIFSLTDYTVVNKPSFIGLQNYKEMFNGTDPYFYKSLQATFLYVIMSVPINLVFSFFMAMLLNFNIKMRPVFRTIFYLPSIVPIVATSIVWLWLLNPEFGLANVFLRKLGLPRSMWIFSEKTVIQSLVLVGLWSTGNIMIVFLSGLQTIPRQLYEALDVDGGNAYHKLRYVTIPLMTPTIFFNLIMGLINGFQTFAQPYIMTQGGPNNRSLFYVYYLYRETFTFSRMGYGSAIAWILFLIIAVFSIIVFKTSDLWVFYRD